MVGQKDSFSVTYNQKLLLGKSNCCKFDQCHNNKSDQYKNGEALCRQPRHAELV